MTFEDIQVETSILLLKMNNQPEDRYELELLVREKLNELKAFGMPLPQDLVDLEAALDSELTNRPSPRQ